MSFLEKTWEAGSTFVGETTGYYDIKRATTGVDPVTGEELTAAERTKHGALAAAGFIPFVGWAGRAVKGGKAIHSTAKGMKAADNALSAYQTGRTLDNLRKAEYGLYGITSANGLSEYATGRDMFGNELSEEQRERSLNEAFALLGGNAVGVGLRKASPMVNLGNTHKKVTYGNYETSTFNKVHGIKDYIKDVQVITGRNVPDNQRKLLKNKLREVDYSKKLSKVDVIKHRQDFQRKKEKLIVQWEVNTGQKWPTYSEPVLSKRGRVYIQAGDKYDAHHIIKNEYGGPNEWYNIHPAKRPDEHQGGIHRKSGPESNLFK